MTFAQAIVLEYESSVPATRKCIERIPADKLTWRPDPKSLTLGQLGQHIATTSPAVAQMITISRVDNLEPNFVQPESVEQMLAALDASAAQVREHLWNLSDDFMKGHIEFAADGVVFMRFTREDTARMIVLNHLYHHRGQLTVYLRLLGVPVPAVFGPSADEQFDPTAA